MTHPVRLLTAAEVLNLTGYKSRTTLWRRVKAGQFPAPVALSSHATRPSVDRVWPVSAVGWGYLKRRTCPRKRSVAQASDA